MTSNCDGWAMTGDFICRNNMACKDDTNVTSGVQYTFDVTPGNVYYVAFDFISPTSGYVTVTIGTGGTASIIGFMQDTTYWRRWQASITAGPTGNTVNFSINAGTTACIDNVAVWDFEQSSSSSNSSSSTSSSSMSSSSSSSTSSTSSSTSSSSLSSSSTSSSSDAVSLNPYCGSVTLDQDANTATIDGLDTGSTVTVDDEGFQVEKGC